MSTHSVKCVLSLACGLALMLLLLPTRTAWAQDSADGGAPGCPFKAVTNQVQKIFGPYDRAMHNGGDIEGGEIPKVVKVEQLSIYTCIFQRKNNESLQFIVNIFPEAAAAVAAFNRASKVRNAGGPFYTSDRQDGQAHVFEGPGRSLAYQNVQVVMLHWMTRKDGKLAPADVPGSRLTPIAQTWLSAAGK